MNNKTNEIKGLIEKAISNIPFNDSSLQEVKNYLNFALNKLPKTENQRTIQQNEIITNQALTKYNLFELDKMISDEKNKLKKIIERKKTDNDDKIFTIFG